MDGGQLTGCHQVALMYKTGEGVPSDPDQAVSWLHKACDGGDPTACQDLKEEE